MKVSKTTLPEVLLIELDVFPDDRGFFTERYNKKKFSDLGINVDFVQDNHSKSTPGVLRGLHYQIDPEQGKLVSCMVGEIQDVAVDIRKGSATYLKYTSITLSENDHRLLWIPAGFAHGFCVTSSKPAHVIYKTDNLYNPKGDRGIIWNDPKINIDWQVKNPILSDKDRELPNL